ncbi:MAG TPA: hypothetical protein VKX49_26055 [Bryobacteraceae bacterium]|nr:hypothetical protein [Bryobacteraceae bacterium]
MQFDAQRAFPYPVLRPDINDYTDGEFQVLVDFAHPDDGSNIHLEVQFALSVEEIADAVARGDAKFVVVVSCRDTYFRRPLETTQSSLAETFLAGDLRGEVQVYPYIVADKNISGFSCPLINVEFGLGPFSFEKGSVLAVDEPKAVYIDRDCFRPITSVFELVKNENINGPEWHVDFSGDRVRISVSPPLKEKIDKFRNSSKNRAILINSIYFAAVMQCVDHLRDDQGEYDDRRWAQIMRQQCHNLNIDIKDHDEYMIAERLLKFPLGLLDTYVFQESQE